MISGKYQNPDTPEVVARTDRFKLSIVPSGGIEKVTGNDKRRNSIPGGLAQDVLQGRESFRISTLRRQVQIGCNGYFHNLMTRLFRKFLTPDDPGPKKKKIQPRMHTDETPI
jgi:hypothetical protein